jgi:hypothetical protein
MRVRVRDTCYNVYLVKGGDWYARVDCSAVCLLGTGCVVWSELCRLVRIVSVGAGCGD